MSSTNRISTIDDAVNAVVQKTPGLGRERYWTIRNNIAAAYDYYHARFAFYETLAYDEEIVWTSGRKLTLTGYSGLTGWRGLPLSITSTDEDEPWEQQTPPDIMMKRGRYDAGDTGAAYLDGSGVGFLYAPLGMDLISVAAKTAITISITHFSNPAPLNHDVAGSTELVFPLQFRQVLVDCAIRDELTDLLQNMPVRTKEVRQSYAEQIANANERIRVIEREIIKSLQVRPAVKNVIEPGPYENMLSQANAPWENGKGGNYLWDWDHARGNY